MKKLLLFVTLLIITSFMVVLAQIVPDVPVEPTIAGLIDLVKYLVTNWKALGTWGITSTILVIVIAVLSGPWCKGWFGKRSSMIKRILIVVLGQALGVFHALMSGAVWYMAIITGLLVSGGAIAIYEAIKPVFKKKE